jgi:hypothetical protein
LRHFYCDPRERNIIEYGVSQHGYPGYDRPCPRSGVNPTPPAIGETPGASWCFMLPVSTPPNAIVYGAGMVPITAMIRAGIFFDILGGPLIWSCLYILLPLVGLAQL